MLIDTRAPLPPLRSLAEAAYYAYWQAWPVPLALPWDRLSAHERRAWGHVAAVVQRGSAAPAEASGGGGQAELFGGTREAEP